MLCSMDSIYDNLENYNDANVIEELTNENNDLKHKLEEYATSIAKLQNDFDKLAADYKKLEINYSSLLKTARAEIERKSQIITNLNLEKDKIILGTIQNKNLLSLRKNVPKHRWDTDNISKNENHAHVKNTKELSDRTKPRSSSSGRIETSRTLSEDTITSSNIEQTNKTKPVNVFDKISVEKTKEKEIPKGRISDIKENITLDYKEHKQDQNLQSKALSIKSRRKSLPATRVYCKFSSDDEHEDSSSTAEANKKKLTKENTNRKNYEWDYNDRRDKRESGLTTFHIRHNKKYDSDRGRDSNGKYEYSHRYRRHLSPERSRRRSSRNYPDDRYPQFEYSRKRGSDSPPRNKHDRHKSNYDRDNNDLEKYGCHPYDQERLGVKQKYISDYEEPTAKRLRTNSFKYNSEDENKQNKQKGAEHIPSLKEAVHIFEHVSCQSPDYIFAESPNTQPVREIKNTAATPLEDPRENSKRYVIKTENGIQVLSTIVGRNIELKPVDISSWNLQRMEVPDLLRKQPLEYNDDTVKEIYMDFDNAPSNLSVESGEILSFDQETSTGFADYNTVNIQKDHESLNICKEGSSSKEELNGKLFQISNYRIPKISKNVDTESQKLADEHNNLTKTKVEDKIAVISKQENINPENQIIYEENNKNATVSNVTECLSKKRIITSSEIATKCQLNKPVSPVVTSREMVEGDLELSDETCDNTDVQRQVTKEETADVNVHEIENNAVKSNDSNIERIDVLVNPKEDSKCDEKEIKELSQEKEEKAKVRDSGGSKKHKAKKKSQRQKSVQEMPDVSVASKIKEKVKLSKEVKTKFSDLFGDSSSLITPEDLGLPQPQVQTVLPSPKYLQIVEDAQDAVDLCKTREHVTKRQIKYTEKYILNKQSKAKAKSSKSIEHKKKRAKSIIDSKSKALEITENVDKEVPNAQSLAAESDVVQTVIISTGVQPPQTLSINAQSELGHLVESHLTCEANIDVDIPVTHRVDKCHTQHYVGQESRETLLQALATSTPAKPQNCWQSLTCYDTPDVGNNSSEVRVNVEQITPVVDQSSNSNTLDSQTDADVPDVRIFIRRRRKGAKKAA